MNLQAAALLARKLMNQHKLTDWAFAWSNARTYCGICEYGGWKRKPRIRLSVHYVLHNPEPLVRNTILHEIAHALAGASAHHGPEWRRVCRQIGAVPERCNRAAVMPKGVYKANCPTCDRLFCKHRVTTDRSYYCPKCGPKLGLLRFSRRGG